MRRTLFFVPLALVALAITLALGSLALADHDDGGTDDPRELARRAVDPDPAIAEPAIAALRAQGPSGHDALVREHQAAIAILRDTGVAADRAASDRLRHALDAVAAQRDAHASGLYWHTDLDAARAESRRTGRPIVSLRLLGRLDEELSCANSRYFRVVLYPNAAVSQALAQRFVLHWSSERPAPRITIDMGDGRTIERTITGNSVHYVIDPAGRVVDAIPGLYSPDAFRVALLRAETIARGCDGRADAAFAECMRERHLAAIEQARVEHQALAATSGLPAWDAVIAASARAPEGSPSAIAAMPLTLGKAQIETPMLRVLARDPAAAAAPPDAIDWRRAAAREPIAIDPRTLALVRLKTGAADPAPLARELVLTAAADALRNEAALHRQIHGWLGEGALPTLEALNARVYAELFLTPAGDPWLGLRDPSLWDAVEMR